MGCFQNWKWRGKSVQVANHQTGQNSQFVLQAEVPVSLIYQHPSQKKFDIKLFFRNFRDLQGSQPALQSILHR